MHIKFQIIVRIFDIFYSKKKDPIQTRFWLLFSHYFGSRVGVSCAPKNSADLIFKIKLVKNFCKYFSVLFRLSSILYAISLSRN